MIDSTAHNIGISKNTADILNREIPVGQLFCTSHTALGFDRAIEIGLNEIENKMNMSNLLKVFFFKVFY